MMISELQTNFLSELSEQLADWKYLKTNREFKKTHGKHIWYFHISFINHIDDFDAVGDVAVEYKNGNERICIVGSELGNIEGIGQKRFKVGNDEQAVYSAMEMLKYFQQVGLPFLDKFSDPYVVISTLENGDEKALKLSPLKHLHQEQIAALKDHCEKGI